MQGIPNPNTAGPTSAIATIRTITISTGQSSSGPLSGSSSSPSTATKAAIGVGIFLGIVIIIFIIFLIGFCWGKKRRAPPAVSATKFNKGRKWLHKGPLEMSSEGQIHELQGYDGMATIPRWQPELCCTYLCIIYLLILIPIHFMKALRTRVETTGLCNINHEISLIVTITVTSTILRGRT